MLHVRAPLRYVFAKLIQATDLSTLYPCTSAPSSTHPSAAGLPTLRAYRAHASEIPLCLFSAPQPVCSFLIETIDGRLLLAPDTSILVRVALIQYIFQDGQTRALDYCSAEAR